MLILLNSLQGGLSYIEIVLSYLMVGLFVKSRYKSKVQITLSFILSVPIAILLTLNRSYYLFSYSILLVTVFILAIMYKIIFDEKLETLFILTSLYNINLYILDLFCIFVIGSILGEKSFGMHLNQKINIERIIILLFSRIIAFALYFILKHYISSIQININQFKRGLFLLILVEFMGVLFFQQVYFKDIIYNLVVNWFFFICIIILMVLVFSFYIITNKMKERVARAELQNDLLEHGYEQIYKCYFDSENIFHDLKNHIIILREYIQNNDNNAAMNYLSEISVQVSRLDNSVRTGNKIIDTILDFKILEAERKNIYLKLHIEAIPPNLSIADTDLCAVVSNLLDNAIEACGKVEDSERWIQILVKHINNILIVKISNSSSKEPEKVSGKLITSKVDKRHHGIGLQNVRNIVDKYNGGMEYTYDSLTFSIELTMFTV